MKLSEKRRSDLYGAIHDPLMDVRVRIAMMDELSGTKPGESVDFIVAQSVAEIWGRVLDALGTGEI